MCIRDRMSARERLVSERFCDHHDDGSATAVHARFCAASASHEAVKCAMDVTSIGVLCRLSTGRRCSRRSSVRAVQQLEVGLPVTPRIPGEDEPGGGAQATHAGHTDISLFTWVAHWCVCFAALERVRPRAPDLCWGMFERTNSKSLA